MKREIKFRTYSHVAKKYHFKKNNQSLWSFLRSIHGMELQQYTGINDVNGKEIYEGDILVRILPNGEHGRKIVCEDIREVFMTNNIADDKHLIIGNIYENPKLT